MVARYSLDIRSLVVVAALTSLCIGITLGFSWLNARNQRCLAIWSSGFLLVALGYLLLWTRGTMPDFISIVAANGLVITGGFALIRGIDLFLGLRNVSWQLVVAAGITLSLLAFYTYVQPSMTARIGVVSVALGVFAFVGAWRLFVHVAPGLRGPQSFVAVLLVLHGLIMTYRIAASLTSTFEVNLFEPSAVMTVSLLDFLLLFPCVGLGMLSMVHTRAASALELENSLRRGSEERLRQTAQDLERALADIKTLKGVIPICMYCKKIRDDLGAWKQLEVYISMHSDAEFSHGVCPECVRQVHPDI